MQYSLNYRGSFWSRPRDICISTRSHGIKTEQTGKQQHQKVVRVKNNRYLKSMATNTVDYGCLDVPRRSYSMPAFRVVGFQPSMEGLSISGSKSGVDRDGVDLTQVLNKTIRFGGE